MHLTTKLVIISALIVSTCFGKIIVNTSEPDESELIEAGINILESCYGNRVTSLGVAGNFTETISKKLWSRGSFSVTLVDARIVNNNPVHPQFRYKLQVFVVVTSSSANVANTLRELKASIWWNHMAVFLILDWPPSNYGCSNAFDMLWAAWKMDILNANLLCYHRTKGQMIYTFNPYTSQAPSPWQLDKIYSGKNDHPWTLFARGYGEGEGVCNELYFEKANDLGGYEVRISVTDVAFGENRTNPIKGCIGFFENTYCKLLPRALNATPKLLVHSSVNGMGYIDAKGKPHAILADVVNGLSDIAFTVRVLESLPNITSVYPNWAADLGCITHYSGYKSQLSKILSVIDRKSRYSLHLVLLITILFFKFFLHLPVTVAFLDTLRLICNASLPKVPIKVAPRIYLGSLFLFTLTMQGIFQGQLASLLTKEEPLRNVNTMRDLMELDHMIYSSQAYRSYFGDLQFKGRYVPVTDIDCAGYTLHNPRIACVGVKTLIMFPAAKYKLHLSRDSLFLVYLTLPIRSDWPLEKRVNTLLVRSIQAHLIQYAFESETYKVSHQIEIQENQIYDQSAKVLTLEQLNFAFIILGIGLGCAATSFGIEVALGRAHRRNVITLNRFHHKNK